MGDSHRRPVKRVINGGTVPPTQGRLILHNLHKVDNLGRTEVLPNSETGDRRGDEQSAHQYLNHRLYPRRELSSQQCPSHHPTVKRVSVTGTTVSGPSLTVRSTTRCLSAASWLSTVVRRVPVGGRVYPRVYPGGYGRVYIHG